MQDLALPVPEGGFHPISWDVPTEVTVAVGSPRGRMLVESRERVQREEGVPGPGWGTGRPLQGGTKLKASSGVAGDRELAASCPASPPPEQLCVGGAFPR